VGVGGLIGGAVRLGGCLVAGNRECRGPPGSNLSFHLPCLGTALCSSLRGSKANTSSQAGLPTAQKVSSACQTSSDLPVMSSRCGRVWPPPWEPPFLQSPWLGISKPTAWTARLRAALKSSERSGCGFVRSAGGHRGAVPGVSSVRAVEAGVGCASQGIGSRLIVSISMRLFSRAKDFAQEPIERESALVRPGFVRTRGRKYALSPDRYGRRAT